MTGELPAEPELTNYLASQVLDEAGLLKERQEELLAQLDAPYMRAVPREREPKPLTEEPYPLDACRWIGEQVVRATS